MAKKLFSLLLVLSVLVSCIGAAFVTEAAAASVDTDTPMIADWVFDDTVYLRGADDLMSEYADAGITDIFFLVKGYAGKLAWQSKISGTTMVYSSRDLLEETCTAAKKYGIRVHAWIVAGRDDLYAASNEDAVAYHFRAGTGTSVTQYMDFRHTEYRAYLRSLIKELNDYDIAGIHFDYIRYGTLFYDWGYSARNSLINDYGITTAEYNAATMAMCVTANSEYGGAYYLTTNSDGYYVYASSGTTPSGATFAQALNGNGTTDANNGAKKIAQMRKDNLKNFIAEVTADLSDDKMVSCAIMPEAVNDSFAQAMYCQDPAVLKDVVDFVAIMSYASQYGGADTWPATLAKTCAEDGCNAVAAVQTFDCENDNADPTCTDIYNEFYNVMSARKTVNADSSYTGKILGAAFFRAAKLLLASAYVKNNSVMNFKVHNQNESGTAVTKFVFTMKNGVKISSITNKVGWGSSTFAISSDKTTLTITNSDGVLGNYGSASFDVNYTGTVSEDTGACMLQIYKTTGEYYGFCNTVFPSHEHSYTSAVTTAATCSTTGVRTYTCSCGDSYTESIAKLDHTYTGAVTTAATCKTEGVRTFTCNNCSASYTEAIAKTPHSYTPSYDSATNTTTYTCDVCGASFVSNCGLNHTSVETWATGTATHKSFCYGCNIAEDYSCFFVESDRVPATCTTPGTITYICGGHRDTNTGDLIIDAYSGSGCTNTYTETIPASCNYTYVSNLDGTHYQVCTACGKKGETAPCTYVSGMCEVCAHTVADYTMLHFKSGSAEASWNWALANSNSAITFTNGTNGSMLGTTDTGSTNPYFLVWPQDACGINHTVADGDVVEVRVRLNVTENASNLTTVLPDVRLQTGSSSYSSRTNNATQTLSLTTTDWQTVQIPIVGNIYSDGFVINRILFDPWTEQASIAADIEIDYIYIGKPSTAPSAMADYLYFDFTNTAEAAARYGNDVYEGYNFDAIPWAYNTNRNQQPTFDYSAEGTMIISGIKDTYTYAHTAVPGGDLSSNPLEYTIGSDDVVEIRFKTESLIAIEGATPNMKIYYDTDNAGTTSASFGFSGDAAAYVSGEYVTLTTPIGYLNGTLVSALRPMLLNINDDGTGDGKLIVDYIYVGPKNSKPSNNDGSLFFDFTNTVEDRIRYDSYNYGFFNYDQAGWGINAVRNGLPTFNNTAGTMTTIVTGADPYLQIYGEGPSFYNRPLNLDPSKVEMVQVRVKLENLVKTSTDNPAKFIFKFMLDENTQPSTNDLLSYTLSDNDLTSGKYITISMPVGDLMDDVSKVTSINLTLQGVKASDNATSAIVFDYIYAGPKKADTRFVYFYNEDGTDLLYTVSADDSTITYNGIIPSKEITNNTHFEFIGWADKDGKIIDLNSASFANDMNLYAAYQEVAHDFTIVTSVENGHYMGCNCGFATSLEEHTMDNGSIRVPATCEEDGIMVYACTVCGYEEEETYTSEGHVFEAEVIDVTCEEDGYTIYTCSCGYSYNDDFVDAIGHDYSDTTVDATCTENGYTTHTCANCGDTYTDSTVPAIGHSYESVTTDATCTTAGSTVTTCANCGDSYSETIAPTGHSAVYVEKVTATCTVPGFGAHYTCSNCGGLFADADCKYAVPESYLTTPATGHSLVYQADQDATCTDYGYYEHYKCTKCNTYFIDAECKYSVPEFYVVIPMTEHNYTSVVVAPTCTEKGATVHTCKGCGDSYKTDEVNSTGHLYNVVVTAPTCTAEGYTTFTCLNCSDNYVGNKVSAKGHSYTYTNNGENHIVGCANCTLNETDAHEYVDGTCVCGATVSTEPALKPDPNLAFSTSITVGAEMQVVYTIVASKVSSYESFYLEVSKNVAGGDPVVTTYGLGEDMTQIQVLTNTSGKVTGYRATYAGINAKEMGDEFTATLYAVAADGTIYYSNASISSIKTFLMGKLADTASSAKLKTLAVDMLNYGAAAQVNFNYDTDRLVNSDLTEEQLALGTQTLPEAVDSSAVSGDGISLTASVTVKSKVELNLTCMYKTADASNVKFVIKDAKGNILAEIAPTKHIANKAVQCVYDQVGAKQMRELITIEVYDGDTLVSKTLTWSIESYVASTLAKTTTSEVLANMVTAMLIYGDSAAAYLEK